MHISDCSSDVCSSDLRSRGSFRGWCFCPMMPTLLLCPPPFALNRDLAQSGSYSGEGRLFRSPVMPATRTETDSIGPIERSEEHTSELQSLMRISYAVFCLKKKKNIT